jgi:hypothetical protein
MAGDRDDEDWMNPSEGRAAVASEAQDLAGIPDDRGRAEVL